MRLQKSCNFNIQRLGIIISISTIIFLIFDAAAVEALVDKNIGALTSAGPLNWTELNNTRFATKKVIFFNRLTKVGSESMKALIRCLAIRNLFGYRPYNPSNELWNVMHNFDQERRMAVKIQKFPPPVLYSMHTPFVNFTRHGFSMPIYINVVRDPIERIISWFYFARSPRCLAKERKRYPAATPPSRDWLNKDFQRCVLNGDLECSFIPGKFYHAENSYYRSQALFFCGEHKKCFEFNGKWAIQQAKKNVEQYYAVVGVLEEMHLTVKMLENYIPRFFAGATQLYSENEAKFENINQNIEKPQISEGIKNMLRKNFTLEIDFYEFCKQRLHAQHTALLQGKQG